MKKILFGCSAPAQVCRSMDGRTWRGAVSLREDLGWPVTFELSFPEDAKA
ncbi:hypothetical protein [Marinobacterium rhizophilum]|nr:hypothetical protein [Marinobacterium rhizophilum]